MAIKFSEAVRNAMLDGIETAIGVSPIMRLRAGAPPANIGDAATGVVVATINLPADWMGNAAGGVKAMSGVYQDLSADAAGTIGHYEIVASNGTTRHEMGTVTATGGGGDMEVNNPTVTAGQEINITVFSKTAPNAG